MAKPVGSVMRFALAFASWPLRAFADDVCYNCYSSKRSCTSRFSTGICGPDYPYKSLADCQSYARRQSTKCAPVAYNLCLHTCRDDKGQIWMNQECHTANYKASEDQTCPPSKRADCQFWEYLEPTTFVISKDGKSPEEQCKEYACDSGKKPFNPLDKSACKGGSAPKPSPGSGRKILAPKKFGHQCLVLRDDSHGIKMHNQPARFRRISIGSCDKAPDISFVQNGSGVACLGDQANCTRDCLSTRGGDCWGKCEGQSMLFPTFCHLFAEEGRHFIFPSRRGPIMDLHYPKTFHRPPGHDFCLEVQPCKDGVYVDRPTPPNWSLHCDSTSGLILNTAKCTGSEDQIFEVLESSTYV